MSVLNPRFSQKSTVDITTLLHDSRSIVLFDGVCNLCHASVQFLLDRDPKAQFVFASLQSPIGQALCSHHGINALALDSLVLIESSTAYRHSTAALRIAQHLPFPWFLFTAFLLLPRFFRDPFYRWIAKHRYRFFGKQEACRLPDPSLRSRFLS